MIPVFSLRQSRSFAKMPDALKLRLRLGRFWLHAPRGEKSQAPRQDSLREVAGRQTPPGSSSASHFVLRLLVESSEVLTEEDRILLVTA